MARTGQGRWWRALRMAVPAAAAAASAALAQAPALQPEQPVQPVKRAPARAIERAPASARAAAPPAGLPSFQALEAAGARIGTIRVVAQDIFDTSDPQEDRLLFRWANRLHVQTRTSVIERALLFKTGEPVQARLIEETERLLRGSRYLFDVQLRPVAWRDGVVDIEVLTRDTWSLDPGLSVGRTGGSNSQALALRDYNLLGTGVSVGWQHTRNVDRSGNEIEIANDRAFGTWTSLRLSHASNSDGKREAVSVVRPFYALDARWAAGVSALQEDRIEAVYDAGNVVGQYRHRLQRGELFGGWSDGLVNGWVRRTSLGLSLRDDAYKPEPGLAAPTKLSLDQRLAGPFIRYDVIEDRIERELNRNLIGRPEFFSLGLVASVQLGWAATDMGSSQQALLLDTSIGRGFQPGPDQTLMASVRASATIVDGRVQRQRLGAQAQWYVPQGPRWLFYGSASMDALGNPQPDEMLALGGDSGLRGYPLRYQSGSRRALFTAEERFYTDLYIWRLFRLGGAAFVDSGRAWRNTTTVLSQPGWLSNAGLGLRIASTRSAFSNVLHIDVAAPLNTTADMKKVQLLVKSKTSF